jgi:hypothetical protein
VQSAHVVPKLCTSAKNPAATEKEKPLGFNNLRMATDVTCRNAVFGIGSVKSFSHFNGKPLPSTDGVSEGTRNLTKTVRRASVIPLTFKAHGLLESNHGYVVERDRLI